MASPRRSHRRPRRSRLHGRTMLAADSVVGLILLLSLSLAHFSAQVGGWREGLRGEAGEKEGVGGWRRGHRPPRGVRRPAGPMFISSRILSPCSTSLLEYHVRKNLPASVRYVPPSAVKKNVSSGVSLYSPAAASGSSHFGCPASVAATLKFSSRYLSDYVTNYEIGVPGWEFCRGTEAGHPRRW
ncbi:Os01g0756101 [Oryza sativa Japonica Group]|uniref:Os01g0756101 protein n=1 Tax=Oryza sativa subsp. japonica TaxID=39947 RepID=A0A0P0V8F0_ORYSJ|nr:Os01g0756101 [Oryza sativa Japonica Group]